MTRSSKSIVLVTCIALLNAGCGADSAAPDPGATTQPKSGAAAAEEPAPPAVEGPSYSGVYDVRSRLDLARDGVLPGALGTALGALSQAHDHPGAA